MEENSKITVTGVHTTYDKENTIYSGKYLNKYLLNNTEGKILVEK